MSIPFEQKVIAVLFSLTLVLVTLHLIRTRKLREEYALVWFGISLAIFTFSIFDRLNIFLANAVGVRYAPTLILVFGLLFCLVLLLSQTVRLSTQANQIRDLAQCVALLECKLVELESGADASTVSAAPEPNLTLSAEKAAHRTFDKSVHENSRKSFEPAQ